MALSSVVTVIILSYFIVYVIVILTATNYIFVLQRRSSKMGDDFEGNISDFDEEEDDPDHMVIPGAPPTGRVWGECGA